LTKGEGKTSPKKTPGEEFCGRVARLAKILEVKPEELGFYKGRRGMYLEPSVNMGLILRGIHMTLIAIRVKEMPEKKISELSRLVGGLI
jgi:hypothetical protein